MPLGCLHLSLLSRLDYFSSACAASSSDLLSLWKITSTGMSGRLLNQDDSQASLSVSSERHRLSLS